MLMPGHHHPVVSGSGRPCQGVGWRCGQQSDSVCKCGAWHWAETCQPRGQSVRPRHTLYSLASTVYCVLSQGPTLHRKSIAIYFLLLKASIL